MMIGKYVWIKRNGVSEISVAPIIGSLIGNHQYWHIFCLSVSAHLGMLVADYLLIKFFGGLLVVKKPYLIQTLRLTM